MLRKISYLKTKHKKNLKHVKSTQILLFVGCFSKWELNTSINFVNTKPHFQLLKISLEGNTTVFFYWPKVLHHHRVIQWRMFSSQWGFLGSSSSVPRMAYTSSSVVLRPWLVSSSVLWYSACVFPVNAKSCYRQCSIGTRGRSIVVTEEGMWIHK